MAYDHMNKRYARCACREPVDDLTYSSLCASCRRRLLTAMKYSSASNTYARRDMLSERMRQARKRKHITQKQLADKVGVSTATICSYERKVTLPPDYCTIRIGKVLGVNPLWLVGKSEEMEVTSDEQADDHRQPDARS